MSSSIQSWQILTAHAQPFRGARDLAFCLKVPFGSLLVWASSGGSGETARMRRLAWTFAARIGDKYQICLTRPKWNLCRFFFFFFFQNFSNILSIIKLIHLNINYIIYFCQSQLGSASSAMEWSTLAETVSIGPSLSCMSDEPSGVWA